MSEEKSLAVVKQQAVDFYGDDIPAVVVEDGQVLVPLRPICGFLGVQWSAQSKRVKRDPVLSGVAVSVSVMDTQGESPQHRTMTCLPLDFLNGWLFGISAARVSEDVRESLIRYQRECYRVLATALGRSAADSPQAATLLQVREMGLAIAKMAEEQLEFDRRMAATENRLDQAAVVVGDISKRLTTLEKRVAPGQPVTEEQASQLMQAVKTVAMELGQKSGRSEFQAVYAELYRKFGITSYKMLPATKFKAAIDWLTEWYRQITDSDEVPF